LQGEGPEYAGDGAEHQLFGNFSSFVQNGLESVKGRGPDVPENDP
jgi:hypothetical protein